MKRANSYPIALDGWGINAADEATEDLNDSVAEFTKSVSAFAKGFRSHILKIASEVVELAFTDSGCNVASEYIEQHVFNDGDADQLDDPLTFSVNVPLDNGDGASPSWQFNLREVLLGTARYTDEPEYAEPLRNVAKALDALSKELSAKADEIDFK